MRFRDQNVNNGLRFKALNFVHFVQRLINFLAFEADAKHSILVLSANGVKLAVRVEDEEDAIALTHFSHLKAEVDLGLLVGLLHEI